MGSNATQIHRCSCSKCDHLIKVQMHKVFLNNLWIWLYLGIIKAKLEAEGQSRSQGRGFSAYPDTVGRWAGKGTVHGQPMHPLELIHQRPNSKESVLTNPDFRPPKLP